MKLYGLSSEIFVIILLLITIGCTKENNDYKRFASAKKDGTEWNADPNVWYSLHFGDSSMIISLSVPNRFGISNESIGFYYVPLIAKEFIVSDTTLRDSIHVRASYVIYNGDVVQYHFEPSDNQENYLNIESYNPVTKELVMSFSVLFETRHPAGYPNWKHAFTEGKICAVLE